MRKQWIAAGAITLGLAILLNMGFLSLAHRLGTAVNFLVGTHLGKGVNPGQIAFPLLAFLFWLSLKGLPRKQKDPFPPPEVQRFTTFLIPVLIALLYGAFLRPGPSLIREGLTAAFFWNLLLVPIGEEFLFRGWFYDLLDRRYRGRMATDTNPFPIAGWLSSVAFAIWHLQNWETSTTSFLIFQIFYTFLAGLWLSLLRWRTGGVRTSIAGHAAINVAASLI